MTPTQLINAIRAGAESAVLRNKFRGIRNVIFARINTHNPHDIWVCARSRDGAIGKTIGRIYLGSRRTAADTEGWELRITSIA